MTFLKTLTERPLNAEAPLSCLTGDLTPTPLFFVRNHFDVPATDSPVWRVNVGGRVARPLALSLEELRQLPRRSTVMTMECAGNGRLRMSPLPPGTPWDLGAVGTARFTGVVLADVLERAGVLPDAIEVVFTGADCGTVEGGRTIAFERSLALADARAPDVLLAWAMNDEPLTPDHGFPLRLVVPGLYGVASVKWLVRIEVIERRFDGYFQKERYVYMGDPDLADGAPVETVLVRALITQPSDDAIVPASGGTISGIAWSGSGPVTRVEVSDDEGETWLPAELGPCASPWSAVGWRFSWMPRRKGECALLARALDASGTRQRPGPVWNRLGYGNNAPHRLRVRVE